MATKIPVNTGDIELDNKINEWLKWNKDPNADYEIEELIRENNAKVLSNLFLKRLEFGTAGLRGCMGPGYSQMNDLVIVQTGQGLSTYLLDAVCNASEKGVIIGYDGRHCSKRFAELTAAIFVAKNVKVYLFSKIVPTPFIPYGVLKYKCAAGIMITASHNPKNDNGYKVYWENGAQIISPHDKKIQKYILENLEPIESSWDVVNVYNSILYKDPWDNIMQSYFHDLQQTVLYPEINRNTILKFTYTPMHGVGYEYMSAAFNAANFKPFITVEEQKLPDPEFSTVKFPNPEEGKSALNLSIKAANENSSSIIIANDPDADRLACATKMKNGEWYIFTGNELGALLGWWMMHTYQVQHPDTDFSNVYMLASTVSSKILLSMAKQEGFNFVETLTGFKWMGNKTVELQQAGKEVIFAYEEAIGFMCGSNVFDKDGISAGMHVAELSAYLETINFTLYEKLNEIYAQYGYHISKNSYWICHEPDTIKTIFERLRNYTGEPNTYPTCILDGKYSVIGVRDLTTGYDNTKPENKAILPVSKSSQMITFTFKNGLVITLRTSGTEPKIKYYSELCATPEEKNLTLLKTTLDEMVSAVVTEFLQPEVNGLIPRTS
ncbi:phosphoglucomutase 2 isoform X2 [Nomia melanderi]|nr:glucose 1,6-bisphosphate synthase isoform X2 [Nomia melanderi]XP_031839245.1 glucose 1,6-bisphosphate synthase isoform X2 [Nomia melanderi]XP_031839246.1 glucose 1,6-bisphosphate synthase isoform X2 [Nomia melanderi]XP_031839247.1 glucose 1,6-bisphosphate synthase isoform X2 [Nomia melanderi]XP_031839248.1 glucose 1,6-bisphosphate synthase isoform X2 [Nomia melanderi]XP_031839249.1 glucose 1,6-bisphosphate synthase isoform X2 [Nomia melanderi]XP_031839250.1 glucose 1,6-bisphosphate synthas